MKFFIAFALIATVASAASIKPKLVSAEMAEISQIVAAIQSPSTDPATAAALEALLLESLGIEPISVGPAIVESNPISVGPAIVDFPLPDGGAVNDVEPAVINPSPVVEASPVVIGDIAAGATPLIQIIVNVQSQQESAVVAPAPAVVTPAVVEEVYQPGPVNVVDGVSIVDSVVSPIQVVEPVAPGPVNVVDSAPVVIEPVQVVEPVAPGPVNVVDSAPVVIEPVQVVEPVIVEPVQVVEPVVVEPVQVGTPIIPSPVVVLPDELN